MMFADMIRTDLIAARMRTCIPYSICKWASFYLLAIFFFLLLFCAGATCAVEALPWPHPCATKVLMSSQPLCWNGSWGQDGELTIQEMGWFLLQFLFLLLHNLRLYSPVSFLRVSLWAGLPKLGQSNISSGEGLSGSCLWDPVTRLHRAEQLSLAWVELADPTGTTNSQPSTSKVARGLSGCLGWNAFAELWAIVLKSPRSCVFLCFVYPFP